MGVVIGGTLGHSICTGLAVLGGRFIAQKISIRTGKDKYLSLLDGIKQVQSSTCLQTCI